MKSYTYLAAVLLGSLQAVPVQAASIQFFEGNDCRQNALGGDTVEGHTSLVHPLKYSRWNDEARSVRIFSHARTRRENRSFIIEVHDDPKGSRRDDWARIVVRDTMLIPPEGICIGSFERAFDRNGVTIERHPKNGLDGKVSQVSILCDATCRGNLTP